MKDRPGLGFRMRYRMLSCVRDIFDRAAVQAHKWRLQPLERLFYSVTCICFHEIAELICKEAENSQEK